MNTFPSSNAERVLAQPDELKRAALIERFHGIPRSGSIMLAQYGCDWKGLSIPYEGGHALYYESAAESVVGRRITVEQAAAHCKTQALS